MMEAKACYASTKGGSVMLIMNNSSENYSAAEQPDILGRPSMF